MSKRYLHIIPLALVLFSVSCVKEEFDIDNDDVALKSRAFDPGSINPFSYIAGAGSGGTVEGDTLCLSLTVQLDSAATKADVIREGEVEVLYHHEGANYMGLGDNSRTKSLIDTNSTLDISCNFLRLDEQIDNDSTALYTFSTWSKAKVLEAEIAGASDGASGSYLRSVSFNPEQKYNFASRTDTIFYHTRMVGWHPALCDLPKDGEAVSFDNVLYANYCALLSGKFGVVFQNALDGRTDLMMTNIGEAQRWHSPSKKHYRDWDHQLEEVYRQPFGFNDAPDQPHYNNPMYFKHYLSAVRIWARLEQGENEEVNISTWGRILSLTFVDQPSTCTIMFPDSVKNNAFGELLAGSWTDYHNVSACGDLMFGNADASHSINDTTVTYPINMTESQTSLDKQYLGYCLVQPDQDIVIAIQTDAGTYQATLPHRVKVSTDSVDIFNPGKIYDVVLNLDTQGSVAGFIEQEDTGYYQDLSPWDGNKSEFKTANCYMVDVDDVQTKLTEDGSAGYCFIGTILGNGETGILSKGSTTFHTTSATIETPASAKVLWQSERGLISNVHLQHGYIRFLVPEARKGNAVIAAYDSEGEIVWSWHIWITDTPDDVELSTNVSIMDRNLGAITTTDSKVIPTSADEALKLYGLYYQWGRKDPFQWPAKWNQTNGNSMRVTPFYDIYGDEVTSLGPYIYNQGEYIEDGITHPQYILINPGSSYYMHNWMDQKIDFLWGERYSVAGGDEDYQKSIYDPCPYGYRVPAEEIQYMMETDTTKTVGTYGIELNAYNGLDPVFLPFTGFYGPDRNQSANDASAYYCGSKGDYQSSVICSDEDGIKNSYFRYHRMRTYISNATTWTESYVDDGAPDFTYNAPDHFVTSSSTDTHHDYTNRRTAAVIRCVKEVKASLNIVSRLSTNSLKISYNNDTTVVFKLEGRTNKGTIADAKMYVYYINKLGGETTVGTIDLTDKSAAPDAVKTSKTLTGTYSYTVKCTDVQQSKDATIRAYMVISVKMGSGETTTEESSEVALSTTPKLSILFNQYGSTTEYTGLTAPVFSSNGLRVVSCIKEGNTLYPPVIGQSCKLTIYVNAKQGEDGAEVEVTINGQTATLEGETPIEYNGLYYYMYTIDATFSSSKTEKITVTADKTGYEQSKREFDVPVYGISLPSNYLTGTNQAKATKDANNIWSNLYVFYISSAYVYCDGDTDDARLPKKSTYDYNSLFGFVNGGSSTEQVFSVRLGNSRKMYGKTQRDAITFTTDGSTYDFEATSNGTSLKYTSGLYTYRLSYENILYSSDYLCPLQKIPQVAALSAYFKMYLASFTKPSGWD